MAAGTVTRSFPEEADVVFSQVFFIRQFSLPRAWRRLPGGQVGMEFGTQLQPFT
jgi:hypothetical protein